MDRICPFHQERDHIVGTSLLCLVEVTELKQIVALVVALLILKMQ
jgi:hypothetical protein